MIQTWNKNRRWEILGSCFMGEINQSDGGAGGMGQTEAVGQGASAARTQISYFCNASSGFIAVLVLSVGTLNLV